MELLKLILFAGVMAYASICDVRHRTVPTRVYPLLAGVSLIGLELSSLIGMAVCFVPLLAYAVWTDALGGGDVKLAALCGLCLKGIAGLAGIALGLLLAILLVPILHRVQKRPLNSAFPLVPYLAAGTTASGLFFLIWRAYR